MSTGDVSGETNDDVDEVMTRYAELGGEVIVTNLEATGNGGTTLGLSIAGNKNRNKMSVFICGIHPNGVASQEGTLKVGDEILEVNGSVIFGRSHLNASAIIKSFTGPIYKISILRRDNAMEEMAVKPLTTYPLHLDNQADYSSYKDIKNIVVRKGSCRLGLMIIEGRHPDAGQGIFVSDIQEGSPAFQAGLAIGDMILSVNQQDLVGADYERAVQILKANEGTVQFTIAKPTRDPSNLSVIKRKASSFEANQHQLNSKQGSHTRKSMGPFSRKCASPTAEIPHSPSMQSQLAYTPLSRSSCNAPRYTVSESIVTGEETIIEISRDKIGLGLSVIGGADTPLGAIVVHEILEHGAAHQDGRLKVGDQIVELNGIDLSTATHEQAINALRQVSSPVRMVVYRDTEQNLNVNNETFDVEIAKKAGRGLGVCIVSRNDPPGGVFISEVVAGGAVEQDGRLYQGDEILEINGQDVKQASPEYAAALLKLANGSVSMKIGRLKPSKNI
ncbi:multiple PDZ domain protein [Galendromus occidentalis]|uniref:Multiple PDZ domain protein n=1 Tax=Galendromus occidentalis TaxID=34638 RepID=A0AAJ6W0T9_9ACAR|nr:multiple PDZ domain protein [Galendromus occidentalis]